MQFRITLSLLIFFSILDGFGQSTGKGYQYSINIAVPVDDRIFVSLVPPKSKDREVIFFMPKIVPGTYAIADYGRYVNNFLAYDKKGRTLDVKKVNENTWKINATKPVAKITYWVDDSFDTSVDGPEIFWPAGTNIEEHRNYIINTSGFFGYIKDKTDLPFELHITRPKDFYGSTGLVPSKAPTGKNASAKATDSTATDVFRVSDYDELIDSPLMYAKPDTATIRVANTEVLIGSYSPNGLVTAQQIAESLREVLTAQTKYLGGQLPVNKYAFIFYFTDQPVMNYGALEHSFSSLYYMPETPIDEMKQQLRDFAAHEFFHILTPLTIHSEEIANFDFGNPKMSKHLWMYEGVTEYFAMNMQVKSGMINPGQFINMLYEKMETADQFIDNVPFTEISANVLDKYHDQFYNVYQKGALIGLCLDLKLRKLSGGKTGLRDMMLALSKKYGKEKAFKDDELFDVITAMTYPAIGEFFKRYVQGPEPLPITEVLADVGINYKREEKYMDYSLGLSSADLDVTDVDSKPRISIINSKGHNQMGKALGFRDGDIILAINGELMPDLGPELSTFFTKHYKALAESKTLTYTVMRKDESGAWVEIELSAPVRQIEITKLHVIVPDPNATKEQVELRNAWLK
jgi:predicted metalloprotease with PDZ domain